MPQFTLMKNKISKFWALFFPASIFCAVFLFFPTELAANPTLSKSLRDISVKDTVCNVWVFFKNKPQLPDTNPAAPRALARRQRVGFRSEESGRPIDQRYIKEVTTRGGKLRHQFVWENAASFTMHASKLEEIASLPFVKSVTPVAVYTREKTNISGLAKTQANDGYGWHLEMVNVKLAHEYLRAKKMGDPGSGILLAFFDSGFRFEHKAYSRARNNELIIAQRDFVDNDNNVSDPDSVVNNRLHPYYQNDVHGTQTLSLAAGYDPANFMGVAWGARFAVARTEDTDIEVRQEEDNWAAAVVWAENLGADIISSSLGYIDFDDPSQNYNHSDMDGNTTIVSRAAAGAVSRGMIVVNSMGNEGNNGIIAPADVDGVIAVGAVDESRSLTSFSSIGPTSDYRIKPDLSAPGSRVPVVDVYSANRASYTTNSGTSFSAPIVSGICALILQANAGAGAAQVRDKLYNSCGFGRGQTEVDNRYGRGIPNAIFAVMDKDEIFIKITTGDGTPLSGSRVVTDASTYTANESGIVIGRVSQASIPLNLKILFRDKIAGSLTVNSLPFADSISLDIKLDSELKVFPTVVKRNNVLRGRYLFSPNNTLTQATATIRTVSGRTVWSRRLQMRHDGIAEFTWNCKTGSKKAAAGVYFLTVTHDGKTVSRKFVIAG